MRALFGFDPDSGRAAEIAARFESGLGFHGREFPMQMLVGPGTPLAQLQRDRAALERLVGAEIAAAARRRDADGDDILALAARGDRRGGALAQRPPGPRPRPDAALRRPRHDDLDVQLPRLRARPQPGLGGAARRASCDEVCGDASPSPEELFGGLPLLTRAVDETLRLYPPAWIGPRRSVRDFEFDGVRVPAGLPCFYSSWVSHRLPEVFERAEPLRPRPLRAGAPGALAARRLRPLRDGPARLHRQALRLHRGPRDRRGAAAALPLRAAGRATSSRSSRRRRSRRPAGCRSA